MKITNKYLVEAIVFSSYVLFAMAWVGGTASMGNIMSSFSLDSMASASFISGAVTFAKIIGTFLAALVSIKLGIKGALFFACLLVATGIFTPLASGYDVLLISRFLMGLGGALMIVYFNPVVMKWFSIEERPTINGINAVAFNVGTAIILWSMPAINSITGGWQNSLIYFSVASLLLAILWLFVEYEKDEQKEEVNQQSSDDNYSYVDGLKDKFNWAYAFCYSGLLAFYICLFTFYPKAGIVASKWVIGFGIVGTIAGMIYSKNVSRRLPVIRWSGLIQTLTIVGLSFSTDETMQTLCAIILGFFIFFPITALVSIPHELPNMTSSKITVVFSLFWSISYLVATIVLWFFGYMVDVYSGSFNEAFVLISAVSASFFIGSFMLPEPKDAR
ncbi:MAG: MFS transporter, partial [Gammaproteobacteria bacterium]|nr:MFS transporter [Gammaproteobacteria bacterium]